MLCNVMICNDMYWYIILFEISTCFITSCYIISNPISSHPISLHDHSQWVSERVCKCNLSDFILQLSFSLRCPLLWLFVATPRLLNFNFKRLHLIFQFETFFIQPLYLLSCYHVRAVLLWCVKHYVSLMYFMWYLLCVICTRDGCTNVSVGMIIMNIRVYVRVV